MNKNKMPNLEINLYSRENLVKPYEKEYLIDLLSEKGFVIAEIGIVKDSEKIVEEITDFIQDEYNLDSHFITDSSIKFYSDLNKSKEAPFWLLGRNLYKHQTLKEKELDEIVLGVHKKFMKYVEKQDEVKKTKI